jgi:hypothetical protein
MKGIKMKLLKLSLALAGMLALSACWGVRGYQGRQKVCENQTFMGISIIEVVSPCNK